MSFQFPVSRENLRLPLARELSLRNPMTPTTVSVNLLTAEYAEVRRGNLHPLFSSS